MNRLDTAPSTNGQPAEPQPHLPNVHDSIRSRCWRSATEYSLHSTPMPNLFHRFLQWMVDGYRWEAVVVVVVQAPQQPVKPE